MVGGMCSMLPYGTADDSGRMFDHLFPAFFLFFIMKWRLAHTICARQLEHAEMASKSVRHALTVTLDLWHWYLLLCSYVLYFRFLLLLSIPLL